jgi:hypothetical protein
MLQSGSNTCPKSATLPGDARSLQQSNSTRQQFLQRPECCFRQPIFLRFPDGLVDPELKTLRLPSKEKSSAADWRPILDNNHRANRFAFTPSRQSFNWLAISVSACEMECANPKLEWSYLSRRCTMAPQQAIKLEGAKQRLEAEDADMSGSTFTDVNLARSAFDNVNLTASTIHDANLSTVRISQANLSTASIDDCNTENMRIDGILVADLLAAYRETRLTGK